ncbi:hypothetical protein CHS0354_038295 [Potamilus streckersoni]|uniref:Uncharacterized protein n=1 Tax=Potamilus streckersoni TaxID=2493646 RepID=A0AAE0TCG9_9BIVA|nr:hypothetical protein CHS0354_038295 [Potamilus streckersoni]
MGSSGSTTATSRNTSKPVNKTNTQKAVSNQNAQNTRKNVQDGQKALGTQQNSNTTKGQSKGQNISNVPGQTKVLGQNTNTTKDKNQGQNTSKGHGAVASTGNTSRKPQETRGNLNKQNPPQQQQQQQQNKGKAVGGKNSTQRETIKEKGWKKRIRERLRNASAGNDKDELEHMIETFENNRLVDGGDLTEAKEKMNYLQLRQHIRDAILRRHPTILDEAIADVENSKYSGDLQSFVVKAKQVKAELADLDNYRHDVLEMEQQTISEIRSYKYPPPGVRETMIATYMVLGYEEEDVKEWQDLTALMGRYGKDSLMREVASADGSKIDNQSAIRIKKYLAKYSLDDVRAVSSGAATFYIWASEMVNSKGGAGGGGGGGGGGQAQPASTNSKKTTTPQQKQQTQQQQQQKQKEQPQKQQQQKQKEQQQKQQQQQKQKEQQQKQQQQPKQKEQQKQQQKQQPPKQQQNKQQQSQKNTDQKQQSTRGDTTQRAAGKK